MEIEINSRSLLTILFRHKMRFVAVFGVIFMLGLAYASARERAYEAHGSFVVKFSEGGRPTLNSPEDKTPQMNINDSKETIQSYVKIMYSDELLRNVVKAVGIEKVYPNLVSEDGTNADIQLQMAAMQLEKNLTITTDPKSNVIDVSVKHKDAVIASELANQLMEQFLIRQIQVYNTPQTDFLKQQVVDIKVQLEKSQKEFLDFKKSLEISDIDQEMTQLLQEKRDISGMAFEAVTAAQKSLSDLEGKAADLRATYKAGSSVIKKMDDGIAQAREQLQQRKAELDALVSPDSPLAARVLKINERLAFLEQQRGRYSELKQRVQMDEDNYKYYQQRGEEARVNSVLNQENITRISIVDHPTTPLKPIPMRRILIMIAVMLFAGIVGLVVVTFSELIDERFSTPEQLKASFKLPVLATFDVAGNGS